MTTQSRLVVTTHLEMLEPSRARPARAPRVEFEVVRAEIPCPELSRFLYTAVGGRWWWYDRMPWDYARWMAYLDRPALETWVAYVRGTPGGYYELERQDRGDVEIVCFGVMPGFIGCGLGGALLFSAVRRAWDMGATRVWVHTCTLDHPHALSNYRARGFQVFRIEQKLEEFQAAPIEPWPGAGVPTGTG